MSEVVPTLPSPPPSDIAAELSRLAGLVERFALLSARRRYVWRDGAVEDGTGTIKATMPGPPQGFGYLIERISVKTNSTTQTALNVYTGSVADNEIVDYTDIGNRAVSDEQQPIYVAPGENVIFQWTSASAGAVAVLRVQYVEQFLA